MNAVEAKPTVHELGEALRRNADGIRTVLAAVNLLIAHGHWLRRQPLLQLIEWWPADDVYPPMAAVLWTDVQCLLDADPRHELYDSGSERGVLRVATSIARGWLGQTLTSCDSTNVGLFVEAVRHAGGQH